jgi:hypothetical protein
VRFLLGWLLSLICIGATLFLIAACFVAYQMYEVHQETEATKRSIAQARADYTACLDDYAHTSTTMSAEDFCFVQTHRLKNMGIKP